MPRPSSISYTIEIDATCIVSLPLTGAKHGDKTVVAPDQETARMMMVLLQFPVMFIGRILFPIDQMPGWMQHIGKGLPLYYAADAHVLPAEIADALSALHNLTYRNS
jgi:ABC-type multidrug transport system permease subunit